MSETKVINATDENFDKLVKEANKPVLVDFWSTGCVPCKSLSPVLDAVSVQRENELVVLKVNLDEAPEVFKKNRIRGVPFLQLIVDGEVEAQTQGAMSKDELNGWISSNL